MYRAALKRLKEEHDYVEIEPRLRKSVLQINSTDFIAYLGYLDTLLLNDIDLQRFKVRARQQLEQQLFKSISLDHRAHYKWCLAAIKNLNWGRYLKQKKKAVGKLKVKRRS